MSTDEQIIADIQGALQCAQEGLKQYPHDTIYLHAAEQVTALQNYLNATANDRDTSILAKFDLGLMAAKELGNDEQVFANHLHKLQRFVESIRA